jgi:hypothetical protein
MNLVNRNKNYGNAGSILHFPRAFRSTKPTVTVHGGRGTSVVGNDLKFDWATALNIARGRNHPNRLPLK